MRGALYNAWDYYNAIIFQLQRAETALKQEQEKGLRQNTGAKSAAVLTKETSVKTKTTIQPLKVTLEQQNIIMDSEREANLKAQLIDVQIKIEIMEELGDTASEQLAAKWKSYQDIFSQLNQLTEGPTKEIQDLIIQHPDDPVATTIETKNDKVIRLQNSVADAQNKISILLRSNKDKEERDPKIENTWKNYNAILYQLQQIETELLSQNRFADIKSALSAYETTYSSRFHIKDQFSAAGKNAQAEFIKELKNELDSLAENKAGTNSKKLKEVFDTIDKGIKKFPGVNLQTLLHKINLELIQIENEPSKTIPYTIHKIPEYQNKIQKLKDEIKNLSLLTIPLVENSNEWKALIQVWAPLNQIVDELVSQSPDKLPTPKQFEQFERKFNSVLHYQDDVLNKNTNWNSIAVNLALAATSVGLVVLAGKAIHSKLTTGQASLFEVKSEQQAKFSQLKKALSELKHSLPEEKIEDKESPRGP